MITNFSEILDSLDAIVYIADIETHEILYVNKYTSDLFGDIVGKKCWSALQSNQSGQCDFCSNDKLLTPNGDPAGLYHWEFQNTITKRWYDIRDKAIRWSDGRVVRLEIATDITERKQIEEKLRSLSLTDDLTGLLNRRGFFTLAEQQIKLASRENKNMFLICADFDRLKTINDNKGHNTGDIALIETAKVLKKTFREADIIARTGGDEFIVFGVDTPGIDTENLTNRLKINLDEYNIRINGKYKLSLSLGIAYFNPEKPVDIDELIANADKLMYEQKRTK
jgi:diguanylate cyclase (GGDEF)-like protein/PAS domain S-box-containing protein